MLCAFEFCEARLHIMRSQDKGTLKLELNSQLHLSRITNSLPQKSKEVKKSRGSEGIDIISVVESIEHFYNWNECVAFPKLERPLQSPIEREVLVILAQSIAICCGAWVWCNRLGGTSLNSEITSKPPGQFHVRVEVKFVPDVAIRERIIQLQIVNVKRAIRERVAFV